MRYETPADLKAEAEIAASVVASSDKLDSAPKMPLAYVLDVATVHDSKVTSFLEIKDRKIAFGQGDGLYLSLFKVLMAHTITAATGIPCFLVARFTGGGIYTCSLRAFDRRRGVFWFGRNDRDENEPCVAFQWDVFTKVEKKEAETA